MSNITYPKKNNKNKVNLKIHNRDKIIIDHKTKYDKLFNYSNDAIFILDLKGNILEANKKALDIFCFKEDEILTFNIMKLQSKRFYKNSKLIFNSLKSINFTFLYFYVHLLKYLFYFNSP